MQCVKCDLKKRNGHIYETVGISESKPVKPLQNLMRGRTLNSPRHPPLSQMPVMPRCYHETHNIIECFTIQTLFSL
jgi:hypothetical protein